MRQIRIKKVIALIMAIALVSLCSCTTFDSFKTEFITGHEGSDKIVKIGIFEPMSGADKEKAQAEIDGILLAHSLYPTVDGKKVELIYGDNRSDIYAAESVIQDLIAREPIAVLGSYGNASSLVAASYLDEAQIPAITITSTNPMITSTSEYYFRACFVDTYQGTALAKYAYKGLEADKAAIMVPSGDEQAAAIAQKFMKTFQKLAKNSNAVTVNEEFTSGDTDFTEQLEKIKESEVKVVLLPCSIDDAEKIIDQASRMRIGAKFLGTDRWNDAELTEVLGKRIAASAVFTKVTDVQAVDTDEKAPKEFIEAYRAKFGTESVPDSAVALGYDAYRLLIDAIGKAGSDAQGAELRAELLNIKNFDGASGHISFNASGDPSKSVTIYTINPVTGTGEATYIVEADGTGRSIK